MQEIRYTSRFKLSAGTIWSFAKKIDKLLMDAVSLLAVDEALPRSYFDHELTGEWKDFRDCHLRPDLILIYRKPDDNRLELVRLGSHSEIGF
ncbi:type II toxin-antitoxin system YafQ family toxin [Methylocystis heyeri]|uniref:Type II toxin-antitoxin system mRNA interferase toxin, RelE/StbE family n=1 Tax=Methylocystis heyeri TaxID=391905 RepID=A0A6B8KA70_9HYPH|nr:type II toxin-antitoxin system YafQ family toxin [Methylocystis heyeri]QGM44627.1 type II toxin-antitoxin system mRNA interferase toxin, RelE/StbE family [Methylocystis heyeri]